MVRIMPDTAAARDAYSSLTQALARAESWDALRRIYLDLAPLMGQLHGLVDAAQRGTGDEPAAQHAAAAFERLLACARTVGHDMRLSSEPTLRMGLEAALEEAGAVLDHLEDLPD